VADVVQGNLHRQEHSNIVSSNSSISLERMSLSGPRFPSIHSPPAPPQWSQSGAATATMPHSSQHVPVPKELMTSNNLHKCFGGGAGVPSHAVSFESRELTKCWSKLVLRFLHVTDATFAEAKSSQFVLAMKDVLKVYSFESLIQFQLLLIFVHFLPLYFAAGCFFIWNASR
jgi:hypothetical protein